MCSNNLAEEIAKLTKSIERQTTILAEDLQFRSEHSIKLSSNVFHGLAMLAGSFDPDKIEALIYRMMAEYQERKEA